MQAKKNTAVVDPIGGECAPTSLDPYGQLFKMLMPRATSVAIYDREGLPLWLSEGVDSPDLRDIADEALRSDAEDPNSERPGFTRTWEGNQSAYVFLLRDTRGQLLGAVAVSCRNTSADTRPFSLVFGLVRPAIEALTRELTNQYSIGDLERTLSVRDRDLAMLMGAAGTGVDLEAEDFRDVLQNSVESLGCAVGALLVPDKSIAICRTAPTVDKSVGADVLTRTHRHLIAWAQVQRRTMAINAAPPGSPLSVVPYKILSCPILHGAQRVVGILALFRPVAEGDFELNQIRIAELIGRRIASVLQSAYDPATGLLTRPAFEKRAAVRLAVDAQDADASHCLIYADVDRLHVLNENHGMHVGDDVITRVAEVIRRQVSSGALAARISGDRFAILLLDSTVEQAQRFADSLCDAMSRISCIADSRSLAVSASFGVAQLMQTRRPLSHALAAAEIACKTAKDRGRGRVEVYQDGDRSMIRRFEDVTMVGGVRDALAAGRFRLDAQPIQPLNRHGKVKRFELLLRMIGADGGSVSPEKFLSAAERYQLAPAIDRWVLAHALESLAPYAETLITTGAQFAINLSGQSIGEDDFLGHLEQQLRSRTLPASLLSFELTETAAVANIVRAELFMRRLQELGHAVALDDFGRGLSSLTYLKALPVTAIKIDGVFIRDVNTSGRSQALVSAIVQLARAMDLVTTAECVESDAIRETVARLGVDYGQGFSIGRPRPLEAVLRELGCPVRPGAAESTGAACLNAADPVFAT